MRVAVVSCWKYRDAWKPWQHLYRKFWPNAVPWELVHDVDPKYDGLDPSWCQIVSDYAADTKEPILLFQEDFFLNAPVNAGLVNHGLSLLKKSYTIGAVRLYPCPGSTDPSDDPYYAPVARGTMYRTSCQATIWKPKYLEAIAERYSTPAEFEIEGSKWASENLPQEVWAFKREVQPWPISYFCSAISRGKWEPAALEFCRQQGIEVDTSLRPVA